MIERGGFGCGKNRILVSDVYMLEVAEAYRK
jgi:hypothetical protein